MSTLTSEELELQPGRLLDDARQGTSDVVTVQGEPVMLTLPLGHNAGSSAERLELAVTLYERDVLGLGLAAKAAGLSYGQMIDELSRRQIAVVRYSVEDLDRELAYVRTLGGGRLRAADRARQARPAGHPGATVRRIAGHHHGVARGHPRALQVFPTRMGTNRWRSKRTRCLRSAGATWRWSRTGTA